MAHICKAIKITEKERTEMRRKGYKIKAVYETERGVPLTQFYADGDFELFEEMRKAAGKLKLVGYARL